MDIYEIRRTNARLLRDKAGSISAMAGKLRKPQSQISAIIGKNPVKNIGEKLARDIESRYSKPHGWLDAPPSTHRGMLTDLQEQAFARIVDLSEHQCKALILIADLIEEGMQPRSTRGQ